MERDINVVVRIKEDGTMSFVSGDGLPLPIGGEGSEEHLYLCVWEDSGAWMKTLVKTTEDINVDDLAERVKLEPLPHEVLDFEARSNTDNDVFVHFHGTNTGSNYGAIDVLHVEVGSSSIITKDIADYGMYPSIIYAVKIY